MRGRVLPVAKYLSTTRIPKDVACLWVDTHPATSPQRTSRTRCSTDKGVLLGLNIWTGYGMDGMPLALSCRRWYIVGCCPKKTPEFLKIYLMFWVLDSEVTLGPAYNEFSYNEHPAITRKFLPPKKSLLIDINVKKVHLRVPLITSKFL